MGGDDRRKAQIPDLSQKVMNSLALKVVANTNDHTQLLMAPAKFGECPDRTDDRPTGMSFTSGTKVIEKAKQVQGAGGGNEIGQYTRVSRCANNDTRNDRRLG